MEYLWLIFALLSALTAALVAIFGKIGLQGIDTNTATAVRAIIMALFLIVVVSIQGKLGDIKTIITNYKAFYYIVLSGVIGALSWMFYFLALKDGKVSQIVPIDRLSIIFALVLAFIILGEQISLKVALGAVLVVIGAIIIAWG